MIRKLKFIDIKNILVPDLSDLDRLEHLVELHFGNCRIDMDVFPSLSHLKHLKIVNIYQADLNSTRAMEVLASKVPVGVDLQLSSEPDFNW